jgi:fluoroquinolone transport system ATP-binding protein
MTAGNICCSSTKIFDVPPSDGTPALIGRLDGKGNIRAGEFSKGMKHRLTFARSLINNPELWFLDEPTTGLDPAIASTIKSIIREENDKGVTIFLTTHNMYIADELCDRVAFIVEGEIKLIDSPKNLKLKYGQDLVKVEYGENGRLQSQTFSTIDENDKKKLQELIAAKQHIQTMHTKEATLDEIFIKVTGRELV